MLTIAYIIYYGIIASQDGIGGKYNNMTKSWDNIEDYSAVETIEHSEDPTTEEYNSKYSEEDLAYLDIAAEAQMIESGGIADATLNTKNRCEK